MLKEEIKKHPFDYLVLFVVLFFVLAAFLRANHRPQLQLQIIGVGAGWYFLWGIFHHCHRKDLCVRVVLEYLLFSLLAVVVVFSLLRLV